MSMPTDRLARSKSFVPADDTNAIRALVATYFQLADRPDHHEVADLFTSDGRLLLGAMEASGHKAISTFFEDRSRTLSESSRLTRHLSGDLELKLVTRDRITGRSLVVVYAGIGKPPLPATAPSSICDFDDVYVRSTTGDWLFESRKATVIFTGPGAASFAR